MKHTDIVEAFSNLLKERGIERERLQSIIEEVFKSALKKMHKIDKLDTNEPFQVMVNFDKGDIEIYVEKTIVDDGNVVNPELEVEVTAVRDEQRKIAEKEGFDFDEIDWNVGDTFVYQINLEKEFGRRLVSSVRQMLIQRVRGTLQENIFQEFDKRKGEIIIGEVRQIQNGDLRLFHDGKELLLPRSEQVRIEKYRRGDTVRAVIIDVRKTNKEPEIIVSRKSEILVRRLFENEVPEIQDNIIEIKSISRDAGERTKICVDSSDRRIDAVGACVGMKGVRIQAIQRELNGEKIDVIAWTNDKELLVRRALHPVTPVEINFDPSGLGAVAVIPDEQIAQAIGKRQQNILLASQIIGKNFFIRPIKQSAYYAEELTLSEIFNIPEDYLNRLNEQQLFTAEAVLNLYDEDPTKLQDILMISDERVNAFIRELSMYFEQTSKEG